MSPTPLAPPERREPRRERLAGLALVVEAADDAHDGFGRGLGRQLRGLVAELDLAVAEVAAEQHLVAGCGPAVRAALEPEEPDVGDVVLAAAVRAAGDVDAHAGDLGEAGVLERVADRGGEAARLRDREVARVGAGARDDVAGELGAGLGHARSRPGGRRAARRSASVRSRSAKFCRFVMRMSSAKSRWMSARRRNCSVVMSPSRE